MQKVIKCSCVTIQCRHCSKHCCSWHIQQESHNCEKLKTKDVINIQKVEAPKILKI